MTCATCRFFHVTTRDEEMCQHPSEANPMHWQETRDTFGCNMHEPKPRLDLERMTVVEKFCERRVRA